MTLSRSKWTLPVGVLAVVAAAVSSGCAGFAIHGLSFHQDNRLKFLGPPNRSTVTLPMTLHWTIKNFSVVRPSSSDRTDAGYFAIFVDRSPMPPGQTVRWVARNDDSCKIDPRCPDATYLDLRNVYTTSGTTFVIHHLPSAGVEDNGALHDITIVLLSPSGKRIGESSFTTTVRLKSSII